MGALRNQPSTGYEQCGGKRFIYLKVVKYAMMIVNFIGVFLCSYNQITEYFDIVDQDVSLIIT